MSLVYDIVGGALRSIGALASGESPTASAAQDALTTLNDLIELLATESLLIYAQQEIIHPLTGGQYIYTIGPNGNTGAVFTGSVSGNVLTVTDLTSGSISVGQILTNANVLGTLSIASLGSGIGGSTSGALGTYYLNTTANLGSQSFVSNPPRPVRINSAFVRVMNSITGMLDFPVALISCGDYQKIGIKSMPGPWPRACYYEPSEPLGVLHYWQNPSQGEMHLFCDIVFSRFNTIQDVVQFPPGYKLMLQWGLAELLLPEYGKNDQVIVELVTKNASKFKGQIKAANRKPQAIQRLDPAIVTGNPQDAGWILSGGFGG